MKKIFWLPIIILVLLVVRPLFAPGFYQIHDTTHVARTYLMQAAIGRGEFPPLWADLANQGFGYPLFHFYAPLAYYFSLLIKLFVPSYLTAVKASFIAAVCLAGFGMYRLTQRWGRGVSLLATTAYLTAPYLAVNLYVRGALAELWALALLPWLFAAWASLKPNARSIIITAFTTSLFLLSHNLVPLLTAPFLLCWILYYHSRLLRPVIFASVLALMFTSFYLLPLFFERHFVQVDQIARTTEYSLHFVEPWQMWNSTWGFGGSAPGVEDGMSFKLGKLHLLLSGLALLAALLVRSSRRIIIFIVLSAFAAIYLATPFSKPLWDYLSYLQLVQFPWRVLTLASFYISILAGLSLVLIRPRFFRIPFLIVTIIALLFYNLKYFRPQQKLNLSDADYLTGTYIPVTLATIIPEYLPSTMPHFPTEAASSLPATLTGPATATLSRAYYPTWSATLSGEFANLRAGKNGLIELDVPPGEHKLELSQTHTPLEKIGLAISAVSLISAALYLARRST